MERSRSYEVVCNSMQGGCDPPRQWTELQRVFEWPSFGQPSSMHTLGVHFSHVFDPSGWKKLIKVGYVQGRIELPPRANSGVSPSGAKGMDRSVPGSDAKSRAERRSQRLDASTLRWWEPYPR